MAKNNLFPLLVANQKPKKAVVMVGIKGGFVDSNRPSLQFNLNLQ
jgi:hypothetical protein